jgi:hypothetical protein
MAPQQIRRFTCSTTGRLCVEWAVPSRKLLGTAKQVVSQSFDLPCGGGSLGFRMLLSARQTADQKRDASFKRSRGKGSVAVKCEADVPAGLGSLTYRVYIRGGDRAQPPRGPVTHDFSTSALSSLPPALSQWDFSAAADDASQTFVVGLEVQ